MLGLRSFWRIGRRGDGPQADIFEFIFCLIVERSSRIHDPPFTSYLFDYSTEHILNCPIDDHSLKEKGFYIRLWRSLEFQ
jgi:hypothetical protein